MGFQKEYKIFFSLVLFINYTPKMAKGILLINSQKNAIIDTLFLLLNSEIAYIIVVVQQFTV